MQDIVHGGGIDFHKALILNVIKYHGPASSDPATLEAQTMTVNGSCAAGANAVDLGHPFGVQCFDPQIVVYPTPRSARAGPGSSHTAPWSRGARSVPAGRPAN